MVGSGSGSEESGWRVAEALPSGGPERKRFFFFLKKFGGAEPLTHARLSRDRSGSEGSGWEVVEALPSGGPEGMMVHIHFVKTEHETLLIIGSLGIQMTASYASGRESTTFIEMSKVKDIVINEAIYMQRIIYYLCILLKDPKDPTRVTELVPVFQSSKPRLDCLVEVYRSCQEILGFKETSL
ncbi:phosphatidylinositol N-acetylglucosaminyltransferase subunit H isoform X2 [Latimeria chalumnae]|uniref:phosphatidylinositol N-acetylglucosaminyltransferase subunit H isoform X2 n=1 Tax=Latimeria chalumnae TaxID=7897 RepID=UPI00313BDDF9